MIPSARYFAKFHVLFHNKLLNRINSQTVAINPQLAEFIASCSEKKPGSLKQLCSCHQCRQHNRISFLKKEMQMKVWEVSVEHPF